MIEAADISDLNELSAAMARIEARTAIAGIVHAAGTLDDGLVLHQNWPRFATVFAAKVRGAWNLARLLQTRKPDFVVFFSTAAAIIGNAGQANHAAANLFVDALAHVLRTRGIQAQTINWGGWRDIGAARHRSDQETYNSAFASIAPAEGLALLGGMILEGAAQRVILPADWDAYFAHEPGGMQRGMLEELRPVDAQHRRPEPSPTADLLTARLANADPVEWPRLVEQRVQACVAQVLGLAGADRVPLHSTLGDLGLDSLMALQLRDALARAIDRPLPATLAFDHPTAARLSAHLLGLLRSAAPARQVKSVRNILTDLDAIEQMSDSDAAGLLSGLADAVDGVS
jgi:acyl carrier protein/short-subunit dehydrogenase